MTAEHTSTVLLQPGTEAWSWTVVQIFSNEKLYKNIKLGCPDEAYWEENRMILWVNNFSHS